MKTIRIISHKKYYNNKFIFKILSYNCATLNHRIKSQYHIFNLEDAHAHTKPTDKIDNQHPHNSCFDFVTRWGLLIKSHDFSLASVKRNRFRWTRRYSENVSRTIGINFASHSCKLSVFFMGFSYGSIGRALSEVKLTVWK